MRWEEISWILRGRLKKKLILLLDKPTTATILAKILKTHRSTISYILLQMRNKGLLVCLDKNQPYNRFYELTSKGKLIQKKVIELNK